MLQGLELNVFEHLRKSLLRIKMINLACENYITDKAEIPSDVYDKEDFTSSVMISSSTGSIENDRVKKIEETTKDENRQPDRPLQIVWRNVVLYIILHASALYGFYRIFTATMWQTNLFLLVMTIFADLGVTAGAHRLWSHRSYKARLPLRIFLAFFFTVALENDILNWSREHRVHHKYSETDADPHNAKRGFFFAHVGWLLCRKHPDVIAKGQQMDFSDLEADPVIRFHRKYYLQLILICSFILPTIFPMYFWGETFANSLFASTLFRLCFTLNQTWLVNSAAHLWGDRPYDVTINPRENLLVSLGAIGEGFHNYHHTFPYDYSTSELGVKYNLTTAFINAMAFLGLAYDLKRAPQKTVEARKMRTGPDSGKKPL